MDLHSPNTAADFIFAKSTIIEDLQINKIDKTKCIQTKKEEHEKCEKKCKKKRCSHNGCRKKLKLTDMSCRCHKRYCAKHRLPESHICSWNPKCADEMQKYIKTSGLDKVIQFSKLESI